MQTDNGFAVTIHPLGATIGSILVPTQAGPVEVLLRYREVEDYRSDSFFVGTTVGRVANRVRNAEFHIGNRRYQLDANDAVNGHCLHGGAGGLHTKIWALSADEKSNSVVCRHHSEDGEQGFPGNIDVTIRYKIANGNSLIIDFEAVTDAQTVLNLANHAYFNLDGQATTVDDHEVRLFADYFTPVDSTLIPTGEIASVAGSVFDFRSARSLGTDRVDTNFVVNPEAGTLRTAAEVYSRRSGIRLNVLTTQPGLQFYTGDYLDDPFIPRQGLCFEAQNFPNAPNEPKFPSARLLQGETYRQRTIYEFATPQNGS